MSYSEPLINQIRVFFLSVGVGVPLCIAYNILQGIAEFLGKKRWAIYLTDALFCVIAAFISFFFMVLYNSGRVRLHLVFGEAVGFFAFYLSAGRPLQKLLQRLGEMFGKGVLLLLYPFRRVARAFVNLRLPVKACCAASGESEQPGELSEPVKKKSGKKINFLAKCTCKIRINLYNKTKCLKD